ncbi:Uncharacterised protein [Vibrio cholerae]|nr:Uncharacterised protein [Vibrio cholerae]
MDALAMCILPRWMLPVLSRCKMTCLALKKTNSA